MKNENEKRIQKSLCEKQALGSLVKRRAHSGAYVYNQKPSTDDFTALLAEQQLERSAPSLPHSSPILAAKAIFLLLLQATTLSLMRKL